MLLWTGQFTPHVHHRRKHLFDPDRAVAFALISFRAIPLETLAGTRWSVMALTSWKTFPFFTVNQVPVPADEDGAYIFDVGNNMC